MIDRCFNPACKMKMHYLRSGKVVRVIRVKAEGTCVEHYWLCGACYKTHDFQFLPDGSVTLKARSLGEHAHKFDFHDLPLPDRRGVKRGPGALQVRVRV